MKHLINKEMKKSIMKRSRLRTRYLRFPSNENNVAYKIQRNICTNMLSKCKRDCYNNLNTNLIADNKKFWKTVKPLFSDEINSSHKITLINGNKIISENSDIAQIFNDFFSTAASKLNIEISDDHIMDVQYIKDRILKAIKKYEKHPSIIKINESH